MNNQLQSKPKFSLAIQSEGYKKLINNTLGDPKRSAKFIAAISSAVATNPGLQECDAGSILSGALLGEALNLSPSPQLGQYYLVPFDQKKYNEKTKKYEVISKKAQFQLGYKGYIQLAIRSGQYKDIDVIEVREGEYLGRNLYWSKEKMQKHALEYSQAYASDVKKGTNYSFWSKDFDGMAFKTMLRQLISKWGIMSIDMQEALTKDMSVIKEDGTCDYVDNQPIVSVPTEEKINTEVAETTEKITEVKQVNINEL